MIPASLQIAVSPIYKVLELGLLVRLLERLLNHVAVVPTPRQVLSAYLAATFSRRLALPEILSMSS